MPIISPEAGHLTVLNLFTTDSAEKQNNLLNEMRKIVDTAEFPGWISSTMHSGQDQFGTANLIQWRSGEDLEERYKGEEFNHRTLPVFTEMTTSIRLLQTEVVHVRRSAGLGGVAEASPNRDDYTVIEVFTVRDGQQDELIDALGSSREWQADVPGFRSASVLRGRAARGLDGSFVVSYEQWDSKEAYDAYRDAPEGQYTSAREKAEARINAAVLSRDHNTYRVVHSRSAAR